MPPSRTAPRRSIGPRWNDLEAVTLLLRAGADAKARNRYGATPLSEAVSFRKPAMVEALLKAGADAKTLTTEDGETVLMTAARAGNTDAVRMLLDRGADVNGREKYKGQTALMWAAAERHPAVVKLLMDAAPTGRSAPSIARPRCRD